MITIIVDGVATEVPEGITVAAALLANGMRAFRKSVNGESRAALCGMGVCHECRVTIDGIASQRSCLVPVEQGMRVVTAAAETA